MKPLAIITICYNDRTGLERTFASVLGQTFRDFAYIVVDGGSTDGSVDLIQQHSDRITHWVSERDAGIYDAQNKGWRLATAPFVLFMNAGDTFAGADVLERAVPMLTDHLDILYGDAQLADERGVYAVKPHPHKLSSAWLIKEVVAHQSQFIRRTLLEKAGGYDLRYPIAADYAFFARMFWKERVRTRHAGFVISTFDTTGFSSDPARKQQWAAERKAIQRTFAPHGWYLLYHAWAAFNRLIGR
jgi:glycosyltransferase involved in cell wall biosynthesis